MKKLSLVLSLIIASVLLQAQNHALSIKANYLDLNQNFILNTNVAPVGVSIGYNYTFNESALSTGAMIGKATYNRHQYLMEFEGNDILMEEVNSVIFVNSNARYSLHQNSWSKIYAEGSVGVTKFHSSSHSVECIEGVEEYSGFQGTAFNVGAGAGFMINPVELITPGQFGNHIWLNFSFAKVAGTNTDYRNVDSREIQLSQKNTTENAATHFNLFTLGLVFELD